MNNTLQHIPLLPLLAMLFFASCQEPQARRPIQAKTGSWIAESVKRNTQLLQLEEQQIQHIMATDSIPKYRASDVGFWYRLVTTNKQENYQPQTEDLVHFAYTVYHLNGSPIYPTQKLQYKVDKQQLFPGLRAAVKLLKKGETGEFLLPSYMGYGYHGDEKNIGSNTPIKIRVTIFDIQKEE